MNVQNSYYKCYAYNGKIEYWTENEYDTKKETSYTLNGDTLEILWNGKKVILDRLDYKKDDRMYLLKLKPRW